MPVLINNVLGNWSLPCENRFFISSKIYQKILPLNVSLVFEILYRPILGNVEKDCSGAVCKNFAPPPIFHQQTHYF